MNKPENNHNSNNLSDGNNNLESSISSNNDLSNSPSIEIIPIPSLNIEQTDINLQMDAAKSHNTDKSSATDNNILMKKWYGLLPQNNAKISSFNRKPNHSAKYDVYAKTKGKKINMEFKRNNQLYKTFIILYIRVLLLRVRFSLIS